MGCKCNFRQRVVGDGCDVCNQALAEEIEQENNEEKAKLFGYKHAACLCCGNHDSPTCDACEVETPNME